MSGLLEEVPGGVTALRGPLRARLDFARDCENVIQLGIQRTAQKTTRIDEAFRKELTALADWGILNQTQVAALGQVSRVSLSRIFAGLGRRQGTLRGVITPEGMLLLIQAMRMQYSGAPVGYGVVAVEMVESGTSPNVARALCGLTRTEFKHAMEKHGTATASTNDLRPQVRPHDTGHLEQSQKRSWDILPHPAPERPEPSAEAAPVDQPGDVPAAATGDTHADLSAVEDEGQRPKQPLLDPSTLHGEELRIALEEGRAWYPPIENPVDESGDSYLQGQRIPPPDDFMADFKELEQADE